MSFRGLLVGLVCVTCLAAPALARAQVSKAVDASFSEGLSIEGTGMHRANAGMTVLFGSRFALDGSIDIEAWTRWAEDQGISARAFGLAIGGRFAIMPEGLLRGLTVGLGGTWLHLLDGAEKRLDAGIGRADVGPNAFAARGGLAYGFPTTKNVTIAVRLDFMYWLIDGGDFPPESDDPYPNPFSFHLGLEFMRWF